MRACVISSAERIRSCVLTNAFSDIPAGVQGVERGDGRDSDRKEKGKWEVSFKERREEKAIYLLIQDVSAFRESICSTCQHSL